MGNYYCEVVIISHYSVPQTRHRPSRICPLFPECFPPFGHIGNLFSLTKIFSLRLDGTEFEPLQDYHIRHSQSLVMGKLVQQHKENGKEMVKDNASIISAVAQLILKNVPGHTLLAHYTKIDS